MTPQGVIDILHEALMLSVMLAGPALFLALAVGVFFSIFQAVTSIQEQSLIFVPKMIAVGLSLLIFMGWMIRMSITFTHNLFLQVGQISP